MLMKAMYLCTLTRPALDVPGPGGLQVPPEYDPGGQPPIAVLIGSPTTYDLAEAAATRPVYAFGAYVDEHDGCENQSFTCILFDAPSRRNLIF